MEDFRTGTLVRGADILRPGQLGFAVEGEETLRWHDPEDIRLHRSEGVMFLIVGNHSMSPAVAFMCAEALDAVA